MQPPARLGRGRSQARKDAEGGILRKDVDTYGKEKLHREPVLKDWSELNDALRGIL